MKRFGLIFALLGVPLLALQHGLSNQNVARIGLTGAGGAAYTAHNAVFAGSQCWMERDADLTGNADGTDGIFSCWYTPAADGTEQFFLINNSFHFYVGRNNSNLLEFRVQSAAGATLISAISTNSLTVAGGRRHIYVSWHNAVSGGWAKIYIDRVDVTNLLTSPTTATAIGYTDTDWGIADLPGGYQPVNGSLSEMYFNIATALDPATSSNLDKFVTAGLAPVSLGATGSTPTGTAPIIYMLNTVASNANSIVNAGTGGNFVKKGTTAITDGGSFP